MAKQVLLHIRLSCGLLANKVHPNLQEKMAYAIHDRLYEFRVMPNALTNAPAFVSAPYASDVRRSESN